MKICVVGLGYVGLPLALCLAEEYQVYGFDINEKRIKDLAAGIDRNNETLGEDLKNTKMVFSATRK